MDLLRLRIFTAVAEEETITRAAERIHLSQPAVSAHIKALESEVGAALFRRSNRGLELTQCGKMLLPKARRILEEAAQFRSLSRQLRGQPEGTLTVGSNADPALSRIGPVAQHLASANPLVKLSFQMHNSRYAWRAIQSGEADAAFLVAPRLSDKMECLRLKELWYRVVGPCSWKARVEHASVEELARMPWVTPPNGSAYAAMIADLFRNQGREMESASFADNDTLIRALVEAGVGISLAREDVATRHVDVGAMCVAGTVRIRADLVFVYARSRSGDPAVVALLEAVKAVWPDRLRSSDGPHEAGAGSPGAAER